MILKSQEQGEWAKLINVGTDYEMELIRSRLAEYQIPVQNKSKGAGAYTSIFMGLSLTGYDIYVPTERLAEAREILGNVPPLDADMDDFINAEIDASVDADIINAAADRAEDEAEGYILNNRSFFKELFMLLIIISAILTLLLLFYQS